MSSMVTILRTGKFTGINDNLLKYLVMYDNFPEISELNQDDHI